LIGCHFNYLLSNYFGEDNTVTRNLSAWQMSFVKF
jgi:hypothetical protein